ncbi:hypothetical protein MUK42_28448 [Musa troglodytarum]|uniref:Uncharacterized protein n=1 Tax=Musa troglodytarum TaxID=320322 RepID=A0A9E7EIC8_9LILI|nr:hypothetical protein MUK42_28448 [Musa troglodytarum]
MDGPRCNGWAVALAGSTSKSGKWQRGVHQLGVLQPTMTLTNTTGIQALGNAHPRLGRTPGSPPFDDKRRM